MDNPKVKKAWNVPFVNEVEEFNETFGKPNNYEPTIPEKKEWMFVYDFIQEELAEYKEACEKGDIVEVLDALCDITYVSLEKFKEDEDPVDKPLFLVFYLSRDLFSNSELVASYGENVKKYLDEKGDNVRLFFMPTDTEEKIVCINPLYIETKDEYNKIDTLIKELESQLV